MGSERDPCLRAGQVQVARGIGRVASLETGGFQPPVLRWAQGIAFRLSLAPVLLTSDLAAREFSESGRMHVSVD